MFNSRITGSDCTSFWPNCYNSRGGGETFGLSLWRAGRSLCACHKNGDGEKKERITMRYITAARPYFRHVVFNCQSSLSPRSNSCQHALNCRMLVKHGRQIVLSDDVSGRVSLKGTTICNAFTHGVKCHFEVEHLYLPTIW